MGISNVEMNAERTRKSRTLSTSAGINAYQTTNHVMVHAEKDIFSVAMNARRKSSTGSVVQSVSAITKLVMD